MTYFQQRSENCSFRDFVMVSLDGETHYIFAILSSLQRLIDMKLYDKQLYANVEDLGGSTDCINVPGEPPEESSQGPKCMV